jgi:hypothetical protein
MGEKSFKEVSLQADLDTHNPVLISVSDFRGKPRLDIRHYYESESGEMAPTKKGINFPLDDVLGFVDTILTAYNESTGKTLAVVEVENES